MNAGDVIRLRSFEDRLWRESKDTPGLVSRRHKVREKGKVFVAVLLGVEDEIGGEPLDVMEAMGHLGWQQADPHSQPQGVTE